MKRLLGSTKKIDPKDPALLDRNELKRPLEWSNGVCRVWCSQCGSLKEVSEKTAIKLRGISGQKYIGDYHDVYFEVSYCEYCQPIELEIQIKQI